ncbi:transposase [Vibrio sp. ED004]|nr:transposase [Vibrio sp. ED004]
MSFIIRLKQASAQIATNRELQLIKSIYHEHKGRYGYRRIHLELKIRGSCSIIKRFKGLWLSSTLNRRSGLKVSFIPR